MFNERGAFIQQTAAPGDLCAAAINPRQHFIQDAAPRFGADDDLTWR
jgi:hypothetical protein